MKSEAAREAWARRKLRKIGGYAGIGYALQKSRVRIGNCDDYGGYRIIDPYWNCIIAGEKFNLSLEDVEKFINS